MLLLNNAINYLFAAIFQAILFAFLLAIALRIRAARITRPPFLLASSLVILYALIAACIAMLLIRFPPFGALIIIGLVIIVLSWIALIAAYRYSGRTFTEPPRPTS